MSTGFAAQLPVGAGFNHVVLHVAWGEVLERLGYDRDSGIEGFTPSPVGTHCSSINEFA